MLFLNLALAHGMYAQDTSLKYFYLPKGIVCFSVFLGLWAWSYADALEFDSFIQKDFVVDEQARNFERGCFTIFLMLLIVYSLLAAYYSMKALSAKQVESSGYSRFYQYAGGLVLIVNACTVSLLVFPFESQTLQFMNENGVVNIYFIVLSYMLAPNTTIDEEIIVDEDGNVSGTLSHGSPPTKDYSGVRDLGNSDETLKTGDEEFIPGDKEIQMQQINTF